MPGPQSLQTPREEHKGTVRTAIQHTRVYPWDRSLSSYPHISNIIGAGVQRGGPGPIYLFGGIILEQIRLNVPLHIEKVRCASKVHLLDEFHLKQLQLKGRDGSGNCFKNCLWLFFVPSLQPLIFFSLFLWQLLNCVYKITCYEPKILFLRLSKLLRPTISNQKLDIRNLNHAQLFLCSFKDQITIMVKYIPSSKPQLIPPSDFLSTFQITSELQMNYLFWLSISEEDAIFFHSAE